MVDIEMELQLRRTPAFRNCAGFLSNFSPYQEDEQYVYDDSFVVKSSEHFYQSQKVIDLYDQTLIAEHPFRGLKKFVRQFTIRDDWEAVKEDVMWTALTAKFDMPRYYDLLLSTVEEELVERNTWGDTYYGVCNGVGKNRLGEMLMTIRAAQKSH
jgi:hypothetical protein